ncbi:MAG: SIS domain-containing protein [Chloroflexota bacterium]
MTKHQDQNLPAQVDEYFNGLKVTLDSIDHRPIQQAIDVFHQARLQRRQVFIFGNGGSASTASHMACDLAKNTYQSELPPLKVLSLSDNTAIFSAYSNDEGYENSFAMQLANLIEPDDIVVAISTSGNSPNVLRAVELARSHGAYAIGFTGFSGGKLSEMVDLELHVPSDSIEQVEDIHLMLEHLITKALREMTAEKE